MNDFRRLWSLFHEGQLPVGYRLTFGGAANWLRFHSLPDSKRYADSDHERRVILDRQNLLAEEVLGSERCWLVQTHWVTPEGVNDVADVKDPFAATRKFNLEFAFEFADNDDNEHAVRWRVHAGPVRWADGAFDDLLLDIADERSAPTIWMSESTGAVFAPYDGGIDLFLANSTQINVLKAKHHDWLSSHPEGL
jgi:hypothetical protein